MVPACCVPCEEVMSLNPILLDSGMTGSLPCQGCLPDSEDRWSGLQLSAEDSDP